jgi:hypothetical protein
MTSPLGRLRAPSTGSRLWRRSTARHAGPALACSCAEQPAGRAGVESAWSTRRRVCGSEPFDDAQFEPVVTLHGEAHRLHVSDRRATPDLFRPALLDDPSALVLLKKGRRESILVRRVAMISAG